MKKLNKLTAVLLCVVLLLTLSVNATAVTSSDEIQPITDTQVTPVANETTVVVSKSDAELITKPITPIDSGVAVTAAATPIGHLDSVTSSAIGGWAYQSDVPNTALTVHIYIINNSTGEQKIIGVTANGYRSDLAAAGYGNGYHAFHYNINWLNYAPGTYTVRAYAIGVNSSNPQLHSSPKTYTVRKMVGYLDEVSSTLIRGWAWKPDAPNTAVSVIINLKNTDTTDEYTLFSTANKYRADLYNAGYGNGYHAFEVAIDWTNYTPGNYTITATATAGETISLTGSPKSYFSDDETIGDKVSWNDTTYSASFIPLSGWAQPTFYRYTQQPLAKTHCEFTLDEHNVSNILKYNAGTHEQDSKNLYFTVDFRNVPEGSVDQMDAYTIYTSLPNPKLDYENDNENVDDRNEEAEIVALGEVEETNYFATAWWVDYRNGDDDDDGYWQVEFVMSGKYIGDPDVGIWFPLLGDDSDYNTVRRLRDGEKKMPYGNKGGLK